MRSPLTAWRRLWGLAPSARDVLSTLLLLPGSGICGKSEFAGGDPST